jgi:plasmid stabilization system protein ParE
VLTPQARADLLEIWNYIAEESPENADRVLERLYGPATGSLSIESRQRGKASIVRLTPSIQVKLRI